MKNQDDLTGQVISNLQKSKTEQQLTPHVTPDQQTQQTGGQVDYQKVDDFYAALRTIYAGLKWNQTFPDKLAVNKSKVMFADDINKLTDAEIRDGIAELKRKKEKFDVDATWPDIAYAVGCCQAGKQDDDWQHKGQAYKPFQKDMKHLEHKPKSKEEKKAFTDEWRKNLNLSRVQPRGGGRAAKKVDCLDEDGNFVGVPGHPKKLPKTVIPECPNPHTHPEEYEAFQELYEKQKKERKRLKA